MMDFSPCCGSTRPINIFFLTMLALLSLSSIRHVGAQFDLGGLVSANPLVTGADDVFSFFNMARPDTSFPEQTQHREQALTDHTNDVIYQSTSQEIIERSGFKQETHYATSEDGYITQLINVINPLADRSQLKQPPVMIFHGGLADTSTYLWASAIQHHPENYPRTSEDGPMTSSNRSLGFMLTNYGYDVWLVATRGCNNQNIGHTRLKTKLLEDILIDPADPEAPREIIDTIKYFDYSQDELVEYEFPAQIEKVLNLTGSSKVHAITYSFSTQIMFKLLASNKKVASKVYTNCAIEPLLDRIGMNRAVNTMLDLIMLLPASLGNFLQQLVLTRATRNFLRSLDRYTAYLALNNVAFGSDPRFQTFLEDPVIGHEFLTTSIVEIMHYGQQTLVGKLQKFDHGRVKNLKLYGQLSPPVFKLENILIKRWMLVSGDTDNLGTLSSADKYAARIPSKPYNYIRRVNGWNHVDPAAAFENDVIVNLPIVDFLDHFSSLDRTEIDRAIS